MNKDLIIYNTEDGKAKISLTLQDGTVWLNQLQIAELFQTTKQNISKHIKAIFADGELDEKGAVTKCTFLHFRYGPFCMQKLPSFLR